MADKIYVDIIPNTKAYDLGGDLYSPINPHIAAAVSKVVRWYGKLNPQTATNWCDGATLNPYVAISGADTWGVEEKLFGTGDVLTKLGTGYVAAQRQGRVIIDCGIREYIGVPKDLCAVICNRLRDYITYYWRSDVYPPCLVSSSIVLIS